MSEALRKVLFYMSRVNDIQRLHYVKMDDWELGIQEDNLLGWVQKLVAATPYSDASDLECYEDSLTELQAKRLYENLVQRGDGPVGVEVWQKLKESGWLFSDVQDIFQSADSLKDAATKLKISKHDAVHLKVALSYLLECETESF
jgi:hypothetical protein